MNDITTTGILSLLDTTKAQRATFVSDVIDKLKDGLADPVKIHLQVKKMEDLLNQIKDNKEYKDLVMNDAIKYGKDFEMYGAQFQIKGGASKYDYSGDPIHTRLKEKLKQREEYLKGIPPEGVEVIDKETGEITTIYKPNKSPTADLIAVTLK
jgi:hypothetical protein